MGELIVMPGTTPRQARRLICVPVARPEDSRLKKVAAAWQISEEEVASELLKRALKRMWAAGGV